MSQTSKEHEIAVAKANGLVENEDGEWVKGQECEYCHEKFAPEGGRDVLAGDECISICDACYDHMN
jgi:cytochrome c5